MRLNWQGHGCPDSKASVLKTIDMKLTGTLRAPRLNMSRYKEALKQELGEAIARAAFEWLSTVTNIVPVWSGASRATFLPLASQIGFQLTIDPATDFSRIPLGLQHSTGEVTSDPDKGQFTFRYATTLAHLIYNEFNNANISPDPTLFSRLIQPGPYRFQEMGQKAFEEVAQSVSLPDPFRSFTNKSLRV